MAREVTPSDLTITPRDRRFGRGTQTERWWQGGDPYATAFYNALSATFPRGAPKFPGSRNAKISSTEATIRNFLPCLSKKPYMLFQSQLN